MTEERADSASDEQCGDGYCLVGSEFVDVRRVEDDILDLRVQFHNLMNITCHFCMQK